jgi:HEAT repeat protein
MVEVKMLAIRNRCLALSAAAPWLLTVMAAVSMPAECAWAEEEMTPETRSNVEASAAASARRQLRLALASNDGNIRFPAMRVARSFNESWIAEIVAPLCQSPDFMERVLALEVVTNTDPERCRASFMEILTSGERALRLRGLLGLAALGDPRTVTEIVRVMKEDLDPDLQAVAAKALGNLGGIRASDALYNAIEDDYFPVREQAVLALIAIGDGGLGVHLIDRLRNDNYPGEAEILRLMALVPDPSLVPVIEPYLMNDDHEKRTLAAAAILSILERSGNAQP